ncbi:MAG: DNA methyltransferase [Planctomycetota bacterium]
MKQEFKTIYYSDYPARDSKKKGLTLAFGDKDLDIYDSVSRLTSQEIRTILGHDNYRNLVYDAHKEDLSLNTYCLRLLRRKTNNLIKENSQLYLTNIYLDPLQSTFRGGENESLHNWYPFLEGYSPQFVKDIIENFMPSIKNVFDPFSGTGTTVLTTAGLNIPSFYSEVNPLLQHLTKIKIQALTIKDATKKKLISALINISENIDKELNKKEKDKHLEISYKNTFGKSKFFDDSIFEKILRARRWIDDIACSNLLAADFLSIAILSSLIPVSNLIRAGDLRFKNSKEIEKESPTLEESIRSYLKIIISDLSNLAQISVKPILVCEDAKNISLVQYLDINAIITSPPYLNGTNYFRNTKIELWFLRCLNNPDDLSYFRNKSITAGINDVTIKKQSRYVHPAVQKIVTQLEDNPYDKRIPRMVNLYFNDLNSVIIGVKKHLTNNATVAIDIGDSAYGGTHVPTDKILDALMLDHGFALHKELILRQRLSKSGMKLKQTLLVYNYKKASCSKKRGISNKKYENNLWVEFKKNLPHQEKPFSKRNWGHPLHSLCSYQGKMKPSLAFYLVKTFVPQGGTVLDPFAGVGTIPFESALNGCKSFSFEISPAALSIAKAKVQKSRNSECFKKIQNLNVFIKNNTPYEREYNSANSINFNKTIIDYYEKRTLDEILLARRYFTLNPPQNASDNLVFSSLLHILHGNRPYALSRRSHPITPYAPSGPFEYKSLIYYLGQKVERCFKQALPQNFVEGQVFNQDATSWWPNCISDLDAVITSPPFFDSTRFHLTNWMRLWFCGWELEDFYSKPLLFVDEKQKASFSVYETIFRQARERLKSDGVFVLHLGKSKKCDMAGELSKIAKKWFKVVDFFSENVTQCESHGIRDKGTVTAHQFLILK